MATVRELRRAKGWNQPMLSVQAGISANTVSDMEQGRPVRSTSVRLVALALGVNVDELEGITLYNAVLAQTSRRDRRKKEA